VPGEGDLRGRRDAHQWKNFIELNKQFFKDNPGVKPATKA